MIIQLKPDSFFTQDDVEQIFDTVRNNGTISICDDKYRFSSQTHFARGGQGHVYKGQQTANPNNIVAIKVISMRFQDFSLKKTQRLNKELDIMKHINPEYAVKLLDQG